ncbi:hypothetical protein BH11PAT1_BH11PAT1_3090 [soil metagenome]
MEKKRSLFSSQHIRALYYEHRETAIFSFGVSVLILLTNALLFFWVVKPQYDAWQVNNQKIAQTKEKIAILENNNKVLSRLDPTKLSSDLQVALAAMPPEQDFVGIMAAIASASTNAGVALDNYDFTLGQLQSKNELTPIVLDVGITGNSGGVKQFMQEIHQKLPVATITAIDGSENTTKVSLTFFSKALPALKLTEDNVTTPLKDPTSEQGPLINKLYTWQQTLQVAPEDTSSASDSSGIDPF